MILKGSTIAAQLQEHLSLRVQALSVVPHLRIVQVGADPASSKYIAQKQKTGARLGIDVSLHQFDATVSSEELQTTLRSFSEDPHIHGIIVQAPLPPHLSLSDALQCISPTKDVDGLHPFNQGGLTTGVAYFAPCTPQGIMSLLTAHDIPLAGKHVCIINRSSIVGRPLAQLLLNADATVTVAHSKTRNLWELTQRADILISAIGKPHIITPAYVHGAMTVIDVGCALVDGKLVSDLSEEAKSIVANHSPTPGGVGPLTVINLLANTVLAAERQV